MTVAEQNSLKTLWHRRWRKAEVDARYIRACGSNTVSDIITRMRNVPAVHKAKRENERTCLQCLLDNNNTILRTQT